MKPEFSLVAASLAVLISIAPQLTRADDDPRVTKLISQSGAALHVDALPSIKVIHAKGSVVTSGLTGRGDDWNEMGGMREAALFSAPPLGGGSGWDGKQDWNLDQTGLVIVDGSVLGRSSAISQAYVANYDLWTPGHGGATVTWGGSKSEDGKSYEVLTVTPPNTSVPIDIWFDQASHLPVKALQTAGPVGTAIMMADFRPVHGLMIPYRVDISAISGSTSFTATSVEANPSDAAAHLAAPTSSPHDFSIADGATQAVVPIQISKNQVWLEVMLNGKGPFHFAFDTGGANIIDSAVAKELGVTGNGSTQVTGTGDASVDTSFAVIKTLQIGDAQVTDQVFGVLPIAESVGVSSGMRMDGLIGYEVLSRFLTTFDYGDKKVVFHMPGSYAPPSGATVVPIALFGTQPQFACGIDDVAATCTIDTGASQSLSFYTPFIAAHPGVVPAKHSEPGVNGFGVGGPSMGTLGRLQTFSFGGLMLHDLVGDYPTQGAGGLALPFFAANVGGGVWKRFTLTLDYRAHTMMLTPNADFPARDQWERSGLYLINKSGITVIDVRPGTPSAAAGLKKGDVIVSLNGSSNPTLLEARSAFLAAPGTVVHLVIKGKDGSTHKLDLTLADYV